MGFNRSALGHGIIAANLGMKDQDAVTLLREKRPGALFNVHLRLKLPIAKKVEAWVCIGM